MKMGTAPSGHRWKFGGTLQKEEWLAGGQIYWPFLPSFLVSVLVEEPLGMKVQSPTSQPGILVDLNGCLPESRLAQS